MESDPLLGQRNGYAVAPGPWTKVKRRMGQSVDASKCGPALAVQCYIAGAADAAAYGYTKTWVAFMTGNLTQLSMSAIILLLTHPMPRESVARFNDSLSSILGFIFGAFFASRLTARYSPSHRGKLVATSFLRCLIFVAVSIGVALLGWEGRHGMVMLFAMAMNMGSMAVNASQVGTTPYSTTVVFTASLAAFFSDPLLPFSVSSATKTRGISILSLISGAASSQAVSILVGKLINSGAVHAPWQLGPSIPIAFVAIAELVCGILWLNAGSAEE